MLISMMKCSLVVVIVLVDWLSTQCLSQPLPPTSCPDGKVYNSCGSSCPLTCNNYHLQDTLVCDLSCAQGCFCPDGLVEHGEECVAPSDCPTDEDPDDPCDGYSGCREDQICEVSISGCGTEDSYCNRYAICRNPPYVPCGGDAFLACDSEWTYCLQQNKTRRADCVADCFSRNGNCDEDSICTMTGGSRPGIQCVDSNDLPSDCPAGQVMDNSDCPTPCHETCDDVVEGTGIACATVCVEPSCICPEGLVRFRDRCVDPRLCYVLTTYPPPINPLPIVDPNTVLLSFYSRPMDSRQFRMGQERYTFTSSIRSILDRNGYDGVQISIHGVHDDDDQLQIVVQLSGSSISIASVDDLIRILSQNSDDLHIAVQGLSQVEVEYISGDGIDLSTNAIIGIAVSSVVAGIAIVVAWIAIIACCCVLKGKNRTPPPSYAQGQKSNAYTNVIFHEEPEDIHNNKDEDKVALENFCD